MADFCTRLRETNPRNREETENSAESGGRTRSIQAIEGTSWNPPTLYGDLLVIRNAKEAGGCQAAARHCAGDVQRALVLTPCARAEPFLCTSRIDFAALPAFRGRLVQIAYCERMRFRYYALARLRPGQSEWKVAPPG